MKNDGDGRTSQDSPQMRLSLGVALFFVLSGIALFGIGLARDDVYYIASGIPVFFIGTIFAGIVLGKCVGQGIAEEIVANEGRTIALTVSRTTTTPKPVLSINPVMKKNKSDTDLELMGTMDDEEAL
jgi:hypothetical protein